MKLVVPFVLCAIVITISGCRSVPSQETERHDQVEGLDQTIENGLITRDILKTFTYDDVPDRWRTTVNDASTEAYTKKVFFRGEEKIMEVLWKKDWTGAKSNMFTAVIYDGPKRIGRVINISSGRTSVAQPKNVRSEYEMITTIKDDGRASIMFMNEDGYFQVVEVEGRETHLMDDLEYTKGAVSIEQIGKPLADAIERQLGKKRK